MDLTSSMGYFMALDMPDQRVGYSKPSCLKCCFESLQECQGTIFNRFYLNTSGYLHAVFGVTWLDTILV